MLKSTKMYGRLSDLPFAIGFIAIAGVAVYSFYSYDKEQCMQDSKCAVQMKESKVMK